MWGGGRSRGLQVSAFCHGAAGGLWRLGPLERARSSCAMQQKKERSFGTLYFYVLNVYARTTTSIVPTKILERDSVNKYSHFIKDFSQK